MRKYVWVPILFSVTVFSQTPKDSLEQDLQQFLKEAPFVGIGVAVLNANEMLYQKGFGYADKASEHPYTPSSLQPIASISKTFLGVSLVKAQELGLLTLDEPINKYLPFKIENPYNSEPITIRHLATHTSGIKDTKYYEKAYIFHDSIRPTGLKVFDSYAKVYNKNTEINLTEYLKSIYSLEGKWYSKSNFNRSSPGEKYQYSNNGAALAALVVESASEIPYDQFVKTHILEPLGMVKTSWSLKNYEEDEKSTLYAFGYPIPDFHLITYADGGLVTSIEEFSKYFMALMKSYYDQPNGLLSNEASKEIFTQQLDSELATGIFFVVGKKRIGHTGGDPGVTTVAYFNINTGIGIIIFTNTSGDNKVAKALGDVFRLVDSYSTRLKP